MRTVPSTESSASPATPTIALAIVQSWLVLGSIAVLCVPTLRGTSTWFGWLPFWFIAMPAAEWLLLRWRNIAVRSQGAVLHWRQRGQPRPRRISRRIRKTSARANRARVSSLLTALLPR